MNDQNKRTEDNLSVLIQQILDELTSLRQEDIELTKDFTSFYDNLCHLRKSLAVVRNNSLSNSGTISISLDSTTTSLHGTKQRSDSEPNILMPCQQRTVRADDDLQQDK